MYKDSLQMPSAQFLELSLLKVSTTFSWVFLHFFSKTMKERSNLVFTLLSQQKILRLKFKAYFLLWLITELWRHKLSIKMRKLYQSYFYRFRDWFSISAQIPEISIHFTAWSIVRRQSTNWNRHQFYVKAFYQSTFYSAFFNPFNIIHTNLIFEKSDFCHFFKILLTLIDRKPIFLILLY